LQRIAAGDSTALRDFIRLYGDLLWALARRMTKSHAEAEDAVQDIIVHMWQQAAKYDASVGEEVTFVSIVARRRLIDRLRATSSKPLANEIPDDAPAKPATPHISEDAATARRLFDSLGDQQRSALWLSIVQGYTHEMIARHLGVPLGTVKTHIRSGLSHIRDRLPRRGGGSV
jgi:RNA polymerase sigma-70 factor (ECF subfamily)